MPKSFSYNPDLAGMEDPGTVRRALSARPSESKLTRSSPANFLAAVKLREELAAKREREDLDVEREDTWEHSASDDVAEGHESSVSSKLLASPYLPHFVPSLR